MRILPKSLAALCASSLVVLAGLLGSASPAFALAGPSFVVECYPEAVAPNDPIVFPGQAGAAHMHTFYGASGVDQNTTVDSLLAQPQSDCGGGFESVDLSAYWIPTLYRDGAAVTAQDHTVQLRAYYQRGGGPTAAPVAQAFPRGLRMIAGDMRATTPQQNVTYACAKISDPGVQWGGTTEFLSCGADETLIARLVFPDCWNGTDLDSADHKSHMAYSVGGACPADHPVKLPQLKFEAWFYGTNGPASSFAWSSGGSYTFHGDVISAWEARAAANLVNQCINVAVDCNPLVYPEIPQGDVAQSQIDAQLGFATPVVGPPAETTDMGGMDMGDPTATTAPVATPSPSPAGPTPSPVATPSAPPSALPTSVAAEPPPTSFEQAPPSLAVTWQDHDPMSFLAVLRATIWMLLRSFGIHL